MDSGNGAESSPTSGRRTPADTSSGASFTTAWRFAGFEFDLRRGELTGPDGAPVALRPKAESLLRRFLAEPGRLLAREELMAALWPATVVTDDSLVKCIDELRKALDDHDQRLIRTVARRGYRLEARVDPVPAARRDPASEPQRDPVPDARSADAAAPLPARPAAERPEAKAGRDASASPSRPGAWLPPRAAILLGVMVVLVLVGMAIASMAPLRPVNIDEEITARATVAVMPFAVPAGEPRLVAFADAVADEISAQFATRVGMRAIGRAATAAYGGAAPALDRMASALKATHVLTGRIVPASDGTHAVVDVQISTLANGQVFWARRYEVTEAIAARLSSEIGQHVVNAMRNRDLKDICDRPAAADCKPDAADLTLLAWRDLDHRRSVQDVWRARGRFEDALREDGQSIIALNGLSATYLAERSDPIVRPTAALVTEAERAAEKARALAPEDPTALLTWGITQIMRGRADLALPALEKANRLVPSYPRGHELVAQAFLLLGRTAEVPAKALRAVEVGSGNPRSISAAYALAAEAALMLGDDERAEGMARRAVAEFPSSASAHAVLAATDALGGHPERAALEMAAVLRLRPTATLASYDELHRSTHPVYLAQRERLYDGLRRAGMPER